MKSVADGYYTNSTDNRNNTDKKEGKIIEINKDIEKFDIDNRFTDAIKFNNMVFISGQVGHGETIEEQTSDALDCVDKALKKAGTDKSRVLEVTIWLADMTADYDKMNSVYDKWFPAGSPPTR